MPSIYQVRHRINVSKILQYLIAPTPTSPSLSLLPPIQNMPISTQNSTLTNLTQTFLFPTAALNQEIHEKRKEENEDTYGNETRERKEKQKNHGDERKNRNSMNNRENRSVLMMTKINKRLESRIL